MLEFPCFHKDMFLCLLLHVHVYIAFLACMLIPVASVPSGCRHIISFGRTLDGVFMDDGLAEKLQIKPFKLPDPKELERRLVAQAKSIVPQTIPFNIESWQPGLLALSVQTVIIELSVAEIRLLEDMIQQAHGDGRAVDKNTPIYVELYQRIARAIDAVGGRAFIRLGSRSPKDSCGYLNNDMKMVPIYNARDAIGLITSETERLWNDIDDARRADYIPRLCIRRFLDFDLEHEFRCFIEAGEIAGITQYHSQDRPFRWIVKNASAIKNS